MTPRTSLSLSWLLIVCLASVQTSAGEPVLLRYQFVPGQLVRYDVTMDDQYDIHIGGANEQPYSRVWSTKSYRVDSVNPDGSAILTLMIYESLRLEIQEGGSTYRYDSTQPNDVDPAIVTRPGMAEMINMVGKPHLKATISPTGEVANIESLVGQTPDEVSQTAREVLPRLPDQPIAPGESWTEKFETAVDIPNSLLKRPVKMQRRFTLRSLENGQATIDMKTVVLTVISDPNEQAQLIRRTPQGTIVVDLNRGLLVSKTISQDNQVTGFGQGPATMTFRQQHVENITADGTAAAPSAPAR